MHALSPTGTEPIAAVAEAWRKVLVESRFSDWIDPAALADILRSRSEVLFKDGQLELEPLWSAFSRAYNPTALTGLFLRLASAAQRAGMPARLPEVLRRLPEHERQAHLARLDARPLAAALPARGERPTEDLTPLPNLELLEASVSQARPAEQPPLLPEQKKRLIQAVVHAVKTSPLGWRINTSSLRDFMSRHAERLSDGATFDFGPLLAALRKDPAIPEADIYVAAVKLIEALRALGISMPEPDMKLGANAKRRLWEEAQAPATPPPNAAAALVPGKPLRLGEMLVSYRLINKEQLETALAKQRAQGGRLGTNLLELGYITESALSHFLSVQLGIPAVQGAELAQLPREALGLIPFDVAKRHKVVPLSLEGRRLRLAMMDPTDLAVIDEISFTTGMKVQAVVAPESMIHYALEQHYAIKSPRPHSATGSLPVAPVSEDPFQVVQARSRGGDSPGPIQLEARHQFFAANRSEFGADELSDFTRRLAGAQDNREVFLALRQVLASEFGRVAIFGLDGSVVFGVTQEGTRLDDAQLLGLAFPLPEISLLRDPYTTLRAFVGPAPGSRQDEWLLTRLGIPREVPLLVMPLVEQHRVLGFALAGVKRAGDIYGQLLRYERIGRKTSTALELTALRRQLAQI